MNTSTKRILSLLLALTLAFGLCAFSALADESISVSIGGPSSVEEGETIDLRAIVPDDVEALSFSWSCNNTGVVELYDEDNEVTVKGLGAGTTVVTLTVTGKREVTKTETDEEGNEKESTETVTVSGTASQTITVNAARQQLDPLDVRITSGNLTLKPNESTALSLSVSGDDGTVRYTWGTNNSSVASVQGSGDSCTVTAGQAGDTTIYVNAVRSSDGADDGASITVTVERPQDPLTLRRTDSSAAYTMNTGEQKQIGGIASGGSGRYRYEWDYSGSVSVDGSGSDATVYARYAGDGTVMLNVYDANDPSVPPASVTWRFDVAGGKLTASLDKSNLSLTPNDTASLTLNVSGGTGSYTYIWESDNESVAYVNGDGRTVTIRAGSSVGGNNRAVISAFAYDGSYTTSETLTCTVTLQSKSASYNASASATVGSGLSLSTISTSIAGEYQRQFGAALGYGADMRLNTTSNSYGSIRMQDGTVPRAGGSIPFLQLNDMTFQGAATGNFSTGYTITENGNTISGTITISISGGGAVTGITINRTSMTLDFYSSQSLSLSVTPANASYNVSWTSSNNNIATVSNTGGVSTTVNTQGREGSATITATVTDANGTRTTRTCVVYVERNTTYNPTLTWTLGSDYYGTSTSEGMAKQFRSIYGYNLDYNNATIRFSNTGNSRYGVMHLANGRTISSNTNYYFYEWVDMYFEPVAVGNWTLPYTINYRGDTLSGTLTITIRGAAVTVNMNPTTLNLSTYSSQYIDLTISPNNYRSISWSSSNTNVATVSGSGLTGTVTTKGAAGTATITAAVTDLNGTRITKNCTVKVSNSATFNPSVATIYGTDYTGTGTSEAMASQYKNLYGTTLNNSQAKIRFSGTGDNNVAVMRLSNGSAIQANRDYTFTEYINMRTEPKASGAFSVPYTLTYNGNSLTGNVIVNIAPASLDLSLSVPDTNPRALSGADFNGTSAVNYINNYLRNALGTWSYITFPNPAVSNGTLYQNSNLTAMTASTRVTSSNMGSLYFVPNKAGTAKLGFNVYSSTNNLLANGTLSITYGGRSASDMFTDVAANAYYADAVTWAVGEGVTNGMGDGTFGSNGTVTRGQAVTFLWRAMGEPQPRSSNNPFTDVAPDTWYTTAVLWAVEQGITNGTSDTTFSPDNAVTREQMLTFLARTAGVDAFGGDAYQIAISWSQGKGLQNGIPGAFVSSESCPRSDVVYYLWKNNG